MRSGISGIRTVAVAAVLAAATAVLSVPAAHADPAEKPPLRLTAAQLAKLSDRYTPRSDGTPGIVATAERSTAAPAAGSDPATGAGQTGTAAAAPAATTPAIDQTAGWETARGAASTLALSGTGDWVSVFSGGTVTRYDAKGDPVWQRTSHSLYTDWQVKPVIPYQAQEFTPVLYEGYDPYQPSSIGTHPYAQADFNGDGVADIAVAYSVGDSPARDFTTPDSTLQSGTFVSVLDGRSGAMLWHQLLPGYVGSLLATDGKLIVADRTGPDWYANPVPAQGDSRSSLLAYTLTPAAGGKLKARTAWTYNTKAPWASWTDVEALTGGRITVGWTDTPMGLGSPRPAAGHVMVLDAAGGQVTVDTKTPGYPRILHQDPGSDRVLVAEQNDPYDAVRWDLTAVNARTGARKVLASREGTIPEAFLVNGQAHGKQARYAVAELGIDPVDLSDGQSTVSGWDDKGETVWHYQTASTVGGANAPTMSLSYDPSGHGQVVAAVADPTYVTPDAPEGIYHSQLIALDARDGDIAWRHEGDVAADQVTPYRGGLLTVGYDLNAWTTEPKSGDSTAMPLLGDQYAAAATDVNGDGVKDLIVGGQSHGVFALDGRDLDKPTPRVLWHSAVNGAVHQLQLATVADKQGKSAQRLVAATSTGFAVLDPHQGRATAQVSTGAMQFGVAVTGGSVIASGTKGVSAYTADGTTRWTYKPAGTKGKQVTYSTPSADGDGRVFLEYGGARTEFSTGASDPAPTGVALDATTGAQLWDQRPSGTNSAWIEAQGGVLASPGVPGAGGHGVAFAWGGDKPTSSHLVQIVDGDTGKVVSTDVSVGAATFQGFAASQKYGLIEMHAYAATVHPADGSAPFWDRVNENLQQGVFATTTGGNETFVGAAGGLYQFAQPFPDLGLDTYLDASAAGFSLNAGSVTPAALGKGTGTDLIGLPEDVTAYAVNEALGGYGADVIATDSYQHGVTVQRVGDAAAAPSAKLKSPLGKGAQPGTDPKSTTDPTARAVKNPALPSGTATPDLRVQTTYKVNPADDTETAPGYTPQQIKTRLGLTGDGTGQTIAIVDAYDYPAAKDDLNHFAAHFDLPPTCDSVAAGTDCFDFQQVYADGHQPAADAGWNEEAALDIEWAHSVAPHAKIVLVEAADASAAGLYQGVDKAASLHPAVVSNSWGMSEFSEESFYDGHCDLADSVCTQSTGDAGYPAGYSSTNPNALAIGGTSLQLDASGQTLSETAWSSTGGGLSYFEKRPAYQNGVQSSRYRATPDVSFVADPRTGVAVYTSALGTPEWLEVGGTSLSAPVWAAILTAADQLRATSGKPHLAVAGPAGDTAHRDVYALGGSLNDVTTGSNGECGTQCTAGPGYDTVTGLGSPLAGVDKALSTMR
ncbi:S53 family peptidase [Streptomyces sp. CA-111067]|uniref:S53 family peptidase n=1 Tax=Streptomyces sp. CA-111067 TaxID=3240046 RepID=UPI003D96B007